MSEAGILPCLYDTRPPVNSGKRKQRQPAHKARRPPQIRVFMGIKTTGPKSEPSRGAGDLCWGAVLCPLLHCALWWVHLFDSWFHFYARGLGGGRWRLTAFVSSGYVEIFTSFSSVSPSVKHNVRTAVGARRCSIWLCRNQLFDNIFRFSLALKVKCACRFFRVSWQMICS